MVLSHFHGDAYADPTVRKVMSVIRVGAHPDMPADSDNQFGAEVIVTTTAGDTLNIRRDHELGRGQDNPMSRDELWAKFDVCAQRALPAERVLPLFEMLENLDGLSSMVDLTAAIAVEPAKKEIKIG